MSQEKATIRSFQTIMSQFDGIATAGYPEQFAIDRFLKKFEVPSDDANAVRGTNCWNSFIEHDSGLGEYKYPLPGIWYKLRDFFHKELEPLRSPKLRLPKGSEFNPTFGKNSIEARLYRSKWTCTEECFEQFAQTVYSTKALRRAARWRYKQWYKQRGFSISLRSSDNYLYYQQWLRDVDHDLVGFEIFKWKLRQICEFTRGSRWASIPKNNLVDRGINIECFGNAIVQMGIGSHLRDETRRLFNIDLDTLADKHRLMIASPLVATIDLKDASNSISLDLIRFVFPRHLVKMLEASRSEMIYGPDKHYHILKKISSMGNGFTFELMSLMLNGLVRLLDKEASVFGDDIIIKNQHAGALVHALSYVGMNINPKKTFILSDFRESCGANYHDDYGYIESYDFLYPKSIGDCVVTCNKLARLAQIYPSFAGLYQRLVRVIPRALQSGPNIDMLKADVLSFYRNYEGPDNGSIKVASPRFPLVFVTPRCNSTKKVTGKVAALLEQIQYDPNEFRLVEGFEFKSALLSPTLRNLKQKHWAKYEMYLASGGVVKDVITGEGKWCRVWFAVSRTRNFRISSLKHNT